jgi:excisionase family DNA binding protein
MSVQGLVGVFTVSEAAERAHVSVWTIRREIKLGHLRARHILRCVRILEDELDRWLHDYGDEAPETHEAPRGPQDAARGPQDAEIDGGFKG